MMYSKREQFSVLLIPLGFLMQLSRKAYARYLENKIYLHAQTIRQANRKIVRLLLAQPAFIPEELQDDMLILLNHYDSWFAQFKEVKKKMHPSLGDPFIFHRIDERSAFPGSAGQKVLEYYQKWK